MMVCNDEQYNNNIILVIELPINHRLIIYILY